MERKETIVFSRIGSKIWVQEKDGETIAIIGSSTILDSFGKSELEFLIQDSEKLDTTLHLEKVGEKYLIEWKESIEIWRENPENILNLRLMSDFLDTGDSSEDVLENYLKDNLGKECEYLGKRWIICGKTERFIILGSDTENGIIKEFSDNVMYRKGFKSYEIGHIKNLKLCMTN